jgi:hypothetical protein
MKRLGFMVAIASMVFFTMSCGDSKSGEAKAPETGATSGAASKSPCDAFLDEYERFANDYYSFMIQYKANPSDMTLLSEYSDMMQKAGNMASKAKDCNGDPSMLPRLKKIQETLQDAVD